MRGPASSAGRFSAKTGVGGGKGGWGGVGGPAEKFSSVQFSSDPELVSATSTLKADGRPLTRVALRLAMVQKQTNIIAKGQAV